MAEIEGVARNVRIEQEGNSVVLRFVLEGEGERVPVEMRGRKVQGVLNSGERVRLIVRGSVVRDRDGVAHPAQINNLDTHSTVRVQRRGCLGNAAGFVLSALLSIGTGALSESLVEWVLRGGEEPELVAFSLEEGPAAPPEAIADEPLLLIPVLIGVAVAVLIFYLLYLRPRLRRG